MDAAELMTAWTRAVSSSVAAAKHFGSAAVRLRPTGWAPFFVGDEMALLIRGEADPVVVRGLVGACACVYYPAEGMPLFSSEDIENGGRNHAVTVESIRREGVEGNWMPTLSSGWARDPDGHALFVAHHVSSLVKGSPRAWVVARDIDGFAVCCFEGKRAVEAVDALRDGRRLFEGGRSATSLGDPADEKRGLYFDAEWPAIAFVEAFAIREAGYIRGTTDVIA